jgi:peptidoglycan hydrolase-like protein with peptidoglycan-binding domain
MKIRYGLFALSAASVLAVSPALAQQGGGQQGSQTLKQEQAQGTGADLQLSPSTVRQIQQALNQKGYDPGNVDGQWGPETQEAVRNFQQAQGLEPTGQPNARTMSQLGIQIGGQATQGAQAQAPQQGQIQGGGGQSGGQQPQDGGQQSQ